MNFTVPQFPKLNEIVAIEFVDHCHGKHGVLNFTVYGRVSHVDLDCISVDSWAWTDPDNTSSKNVERFNIAVRAILNIRVLT